MLNIFNDIVIKTEQKTTKLLKAESDMTITNLFLGSFILTEPIAFWFFDKRTLVYRKKLILIMLFVLVTACMTTGGSKQHGKKEDQLLFLEAQKALDARDYIDAVDLFQLFIDRFPNSEGYTLALQRLGESFEGLIEIEYRKRIADGEQEAVVKQDFLSSYGHYKCWEETPDGLAYNLTHYKTIIEKFPDSLVADEAAYRIIPWEKDYKGSPEGLLRELRHLEKILEQYPSSSLRYEILYKIARRCHILYEIYAFSPHTNIRDKEKAEHYRTKAVFIYKLALESPSQTKYSHQAWEGLILLEEGRKRIYILE